MRRIILMIRINKNIWWNFQSYFSIIFIPDFNLSSCELGNFIFNVLYYCIASFYTDITLKQNKIVEHAVAKLYNDVHNTSTVPSEKSKLVSFASSILKNIVVFAFPSQARFPVKLIYWTAFGSTSSACCLLKSIAIIL